MKQKFPKGKFTKDDLIKVQTMEINLLRVKLRMAISSIDFLRKKNKEFQEYFETINNSI